MLKYIMCILVQPYTIVLRDKYRHINIHIRFRQMTVSVLFRSHDKARGVKVTFPKNLNWNRSHLAVQETEGWYVYKNGKKPSKIMGNKLNVLRKRERRLASAL